MKWEAMILNLLIEPQNIWKAKTKKNQEIIDAKLIEENTSILKNIEV